MSCVRVCNLHVMLCVRNVSPGSQFQYVQCHLRSWVSSSRCVGKPSSGVLLLAVPVLVMSSDRCSLDMLKASPDWTLLRHSSFKVALVLVLSALELAGGSLVVLFFLVVLLPPPDDDDDLRLLAVAE